MPNLAYTGILELVRPDRMVPTRPSRRRDRLPRLDGHFRHHLQRLALVELSRRYSERLCHACARVFWVDRDCDLSVSGCVCWCCTLADWR